MHGGYDFPGHRTEDKPILADFSTFPSHLKLDVERREAWPANSTSFAEDFIILSEFSEIEGPKPLFIIPTDGGGSFDINSFTLRIMAVDYQNQEKGSFSLAEDTQLFLSEKSECLHAYVHHFTLYDMQARGYVRPLCMSYLSHCKRKLMDNLQHLSDEFSKVSKYFKFGNRVVFSKDLEEHMLYLLDKQEELTHNLKEDQKVADTEYEDELREAQRDLEELWNEAYQMINILKLNVHDPKLSDTLKRLEELAQRGSRPRSPTTFSLDPTRSISDYNIYGAGLRETVNLRRVSSLPDIKKEHERKQKYSTMRQAKMDQVRKSHTKQLRSIHELCEWGAREAIIRLRNVYKFYSREAVVIEIEREESLLLNPSSSMLTIGRSLISNIMNNVDLSKSYFPWTNMFYGEGKPQIKRQFSNSSIASLYSLESFESCLDDDIILSAKSSVDRDTLYSPFINMHAGCLEEDSDTEVGSHQTGSSESFDVVDLSEISISPRESLQLSSSFDNIQRDDHEHSSSLDRMKSLSTGNLTHVDFIHNFLSTKYSNNYPPGVRTSTLLPPENQHRVSRSLSRGRTLKHGGAHHPVFRIRKHKMKEYLMEHQQKGNPHIHTGHFNVPHLDRSESVKTRPPKTRNTTASAVQCYAEQVYNLPEWGPGSNLILFRYWFNNGIHLLYALMTGRPVVILAEPYNEKHARALVTALWLFVPGHSSHQKVILWHKKRLQLEDLTRYKLIGLCKSRKNMIPACLQQHISLLDFESGSFWTPKYEGTFLHMIFENKKCFDNNETYMAFVHSIFLELAAKAFVFYYAHCLGLNPHPNEHVFRETNIPRRYAIKEDVIDIMRKINVFHCDVKIVQYLAEVIKQQQLDNYKHHKEIQLDPGMYDGEIQTEGSDAPRIVLDFCSIPHFKKPPNQNS